MSITLEQLLSDYRDQNGSSYQLWRRAHESLPGGNTRTGVHVDPFPIYTEQGAGVHVTDVDGNKRLDLVCNATVLILGHAHPFTLPREVITFQCGELPGVNYDAEFSNLAEARVHFGIDTHRQAKKEGTADRVRFSRRTGLSQSQTSAALGVSLSTVKRHWRL